MTEAVESRHSPVNRVLSEDERKSCWVCFATDKDDLEAAWVRPCRCRGTTKWVHQMCLQRWVDEKQRGNLSAKISCPMCNTEYVIILPKSGVLVAGMEILDRVIDKVCPFVAGGLFVISGYWAAVTYGAVTVMQVYGHKEGLNVMEKADPLFLLISLPSIPVMLMAGKMIPWEDYILRFWRKHSSKLPILSYFWPDEVTPRSPTQTPDYTDPVSVTRILCGALILPSISVAIGKMMFGNVQSNCQRTLMGGIAFIAIKGMMRIYFKQQQYIRHSQRTALDYEEPETPVVPSPPSPSQQPQQPPPPQQQQGGPQQEHVQP